jgi:hypothetical protein
MRLLAHLLMKLFVLVVQFSVSYLFEMTIHNLHPGYARLGLGIDKADSNARTRIDEIKAKLIGAEN